MVNKVILLGNIGNDPEVKNLSNDSKLVRFSLATNESYKNKSGERVDNTTWHNIVVWNGLAGFVEKYLQKGDKIYLEGKIVNRTWDKDDGTKGYASEVIANSINALSFNKNETSDKSNSSVSNGNNNSSNDTDPNNAPLGDDDFGDDLPF